MTGEGGWRTTSDNVAVARVPFPGGNSIVVRVFFCASRRVRPTPAVSFTATMTARTSSSSASPQVYV